MANAFHHDGARIMDVIESPAPGRPVDRSKSGRQMGVLPAIVVVDMCCRQQRHGGLGLPGNGPGDMGMSGIECQRQVGKIQLCQESGEIGHPAPGMDARRHILDTDPDTQYGGMLGQFEESSSERGPARFNLIRVG